MCPEKEGTRLSFVCPVCNGLEKLVQLCPVCENIMQDHGKESDHWGPYSPYRPADELKLINGYPDLLFRQCIHQTVCAQCGKEELVAVDEQLY